MKLKASRFIVFASAALLLAVSALSASASPSKMLVNGRLAAQHGAKPMQNAELDFELVNKTGYRISGLYLSPSAADEWGPNLIQEDLDTNTAIQIVFAPEIDAVTWDLRADWSMEDEDAEQEFVFWKGLSLDEINRLTLAYNASTDQTSAKAE